MITVVSTFVPNFNVSYIIPTVTIRETAESEDEFTFEYQDRKIKTTIIHSYPENSTFNEKLSVYEVETKRLAINTYVFSLQENDLHKLLLSDSKPLLIYMSKDKKAILINHLDFKDVSDCYKVFEELE